MALTKTNIEYGQFAWNFYPGCLHKQQGICPVPHCWAEGLTKHYKTWGNFNEPHLIPERLLDPLKRRKHARILVNFMGDIFGDWVNPNMVIQDPYTDIQCASTLKMALVETLKNCPQHTFFFLTKAPQNIWKIQWPDNCRMGATAWDAESLIDALDGLSKVEARNEWLSIEPLLDRLNGGECEGKRLDGLKTAGINWLVIGAQSQPDKQPPIEDIREIVEAADRAGIPVWLKENMVKAFNINGNKDHLYFPPWATARGKYRQELPI